MTLLFTPTQLSETRVPVSCTPGAPNKGWTLGDHDLQARGMEVSALEGSLLAGQGAAGGSGTSTAAQVPQGRLGRAPAHCAEAGIPGCWDWGTAPAREGWEGCCTISLKTLLCQLLSFALSSRQASVWGGEFHQEPPLPKEGQRSASLCCNF